MEFETMIAKAAEVLNSKGENGFETALLTDKRNLRIFFCRIPCESTDLNLCKDFHILRRHRTNKRTVFAGCRLDEMVAANDTKITKIANVYLNPDIKTGVNVP